MHRILNTVWRHSPDFGSISQALSYGFPKFIKNESPTTTDLASLSPPALRQIAQTATNILDQEIKHFVIIRRNLLAGEQNSHRRLNDLDLLHYLFSQTN